MDEKCENTEELCSGLQWMEDRGMVSREHTLSLSDHDGEVIANKNDHLGMLMQRKRRAMATMIMTQCLKSYDINAYDQREWTPLMSGVYEEEPELCRLLCERGDVDVEKGGEYCGSTALFTAAFFSSMECMKILLDVGKANVNATNNHLDTPLLN